MKGRIILFAALLCCACSASTEEDRIEEVVDELVEALNAGDTAKVASLYADGTVPLMNSAGDSSVIYRLLHTAGGSDYRAGDVTTVVIEDQAQATFHLEGDVSRAGDQVGTMLLQLKMELARTGQGWRFVSGSEVQTSGL